MKNLFVKDLKEGISVLGEDFAVQKISPATMKDGRTYYNVELTDKTGPVSAKVWPDAVAKVDLSLEGMVATVNADIEKYKDAIQLKINSLVAATNYDAENFMPTSKNSLDEMWDELQGYVSKIKNKHLKTLVNNVFEQDTSDEFKNSAAALAVHHAYRGGLLEHTLEMLKMSDSLATTYPKLNKDLMISGIILHDVGKIKEYETGLTLKITPVGKLLGHIFIGSEHARKAAPKDMPTDLLDELTHLILSHHGQLEFGSPVKPRTPEALAISMFDDTSAKVNAAYTMVHELADGTLFTGYHRQLGTEIYKSPYLDELVNEDLPF